MAQAPTLYSFAMTLNHTDRGVSAELDMRTARHPSETLERVWLRVLAFAWHYEERITFGPGLSDPDAPDLVAQDFTGETRLWVRVGKADPVKVQKAADQHPLARVAVLFESPQRLAAFCEEARGLTRLGKVELVAVDPALVAALAQGDERRARVTVTIAGDHFYVERDGKSFDGEATRRDLP
jgi:uncharacterized protein YaeQ